MGMGGASFLNWQEAASVSSCEVAVQLIPAAEMLLLQLSVRRCDAATAGQGAQRRGRPSPGCHHQRRFSDEFMCGEMTLTVTGGLYVSLSSSLAVMDPKSGIRTSVQLLLGANTASLAPTNSMAVFTG